MLALVPVEITERGTRVEARTRYPSGDDRRRTGRRNVNVSVAYTVAAPEGTRILVKSISGNISVRDILGGLTLETVSGTVRIANAGPHGERAVDLRRHRAERHEGRGRARSRHASAARCGFAASPPGA